MTNTYLARQLLLERAKITPVAAIERLVGLQAQLARPPFVGLWARLAKFAAGDLTKLLFDKTVVRAVAMRGTLHVMTAADFLSLRAALQPGLTAGMLSILRDKAKNLPLDAAIDFARTKFPCTFEDLRDALEKKFPQAETRALAYAVRMTLPLVQLPEPDEPWAFPASAKFQAADTWLGAQLGPADPAELVRRYLRGYGPATVRDAQVWTGLPNLAPAFAGLTAEGKLFDVPDAPTSSIAPPIRFIPAFDNLVLAHHERSRIIDDAHRAKVTTKNLQVNPTVLVDGRVAGTWKLERTKDVATLTVTPFGKLSIAAVTAEGERVAKFMEPDASTYVVKSPVRLGLIGDIHAEDERLAEALGVLAGVDAVLAVGDICDGPGDLDRCCALLAERGVLAVRGNHDRWFLANQLRTLPDATMAVSAATRAYLEALPQTRIIESVLLCHGLGANDMAGLHPHDEGYALEANTEVAKLVGKHAIVVAGHTHHRMIRTIGGTIFVNPGTLYRAHDPGFMLLDTAARTVEIHLFGGAGPTQHRLDDRFP